MILADEPTGNVLSARGEHRGGDYGSRLIELADGWVLRDEAMAGQSV